MMPASSRFLPCLSTKYLMRNAYRFKSNKQTKTEQIGFRTENIINTNELTYLTKKKITFQDGKFLVYRGKKGFMVSFQRFFWYYTSISGIATLIYLNPFKAVFPAAIPILWFAELILIKMMFKRYQWNQNIVYEIYLLSSGSTTEIYYADKTRRKWFGEPQVATYYNTLFADPIQKQKAEVMPNYNKFPESLDDMNKKDWGRAWCKYYSNGQNYLLIPKKCQLAQKDVLLNIFKGKTIKSRL